MNQLVKASVHVFHKVPVSAFKDPPSLLMAEVGRAPMKLADCSGASFSVSSPGEIASQPT